VYQKIKVKAGKWADSLQNPDRVVKKKRFAFAKPKFEKVTSPENTARRHMMAEIGEDELSKDFRFQLMQKYGVITARIDRKVTKPNWMEVSRWKELKQEFHQATKGLVPQQSRPRPNLTVRPKSSKPWSQIHHKKYNGPSPTSVRPA